MALARIGAPPFTCFSLRTHFQREAMKRAAALRLDKSAVMLRDGICCLALNVSFTDDGKNPSATRYIPVPDLLMRLGFNDWVRSRPGGPHAPFFPGIAENPEIVELSNIFSKRCATLFKQLGVKDWNQDLYALRKTVSTSLSIAGTEESKRQEIAGHRGGSPACLCAPQMPGDTRLVEKVAGEGAVLFQTHQPRGDVFHLVIGVVFEQSAIFQPTDFQKVWQARSVTSVKVV